MYINRELNEYEMQGLTKSEHSTIHSWLRRKYSKENCHCAHCHNPYCKLDYALIKGMKYEKNIANYILLCEVCHHDYDQRTQAKMMIPILELEQKSFLELKKLEGELKRLLVATSELKKRKKPANYKPPISPLLNEDLRRQMKEYDEAYPNG